MFESDSSDSNDLALENDITEATKFIKSKSVKIEETKAVTTSFFHYLLKNYSLKTNLALSLKDIFR